MATLMPAPTNALTMPRPIPLAPPVTKATLPRSSFMMGSRCLPRRSRERRAGRVPREERGCRELAREERPLDEKVLVGRQAPQAREVLLEPRRVVRVIDEPLVLAGLWRDELPEHAPPLLAVAIEHFLAGLSVDDGRERFVEHEAVEHAGGEPEAAGRVRHVRRVAREHDAPDAEALRGPLMHAVRRPLFELVLSAVRQNGAEVRGYALEHALLWQARVLAIRAAPQARPVDLHDDRAEAGIDEHRRAREPEMPREVIDDVRRDEALRPSHALEAEPERLAHRAARAIGADHPGGAQLPRSLRRAHLDRDAASILDESRHARAEQDARPRNAAQMLERNLGEPVLSEVNVVGMRGVVGERRERPADGLPRREDAVHVVLLREADALHVGEYAEPFEPVEHRPVVHDGAGGIDDRGLALDDRDANAGAREAE